MLELKENQLVLSFPDVHRKAHLSLELERTLRVPNDGNSYPLPPGLGRFPLMRVEDASSEVASRWREQGGVMTPMYQAEALWVNFASRYLSWRETQYPFAVKVATGRINAITGSSLFADVSADPQDYVVIPEQPWLDGYCVAEGIVRQFVAMPLGDGVTAEEQIAGEAEHGGLQIIVYPMKRKVFDRLYPRISMFRALREPASWMTLLYGMISAALFHVIFLTALLRSPEAAATADASVPWYVYALGGLALVGVGRLMIQAVGRGTPFEGSLGVAPGGSVVQDVYEDPYGPGVWDMDHAIQCSVHLANSQMWEQMTGSRPPDRPPTARQYDAAGLPWFDYYDELAKPLSGSQELAQMQTVADIDDTSHALWPSRIVGLRRRWRRQAVRGPDGIDAPIRQAGPAQTDIPSGTAETAICFACGEQAGTGAMSVSLCHGSDWRQNRTISVPRCARCKSSAWRLHVIGWQRLAAGERRKAWLLGVPNAVVIPFASWIWVALVMKLVEGMAAEPIRVGDLLVQVAAVSLLTSLNYDWLRAVTENTLPAISAHLKKSLVESYPEIAAACSEEDWVIESVTV